MRLAQSATAKQTPNIPASNHPAAYTILVVESLAFDRERFQQDSQNTTDKQGLGLGLAIVCHLVELHGRTVTAESPRLGQEATFTVKLPLLDNGDRTYKHLWLD